MALKYRINKKAAQIKFEEIFEKELKEKLRGLLLSGHPAAQLTQALLVAVALGGIIFAGAALPNLFAALGKLRGRKNRISREGFYKLRQSFYDLRRSGRIEYLRSEGEEDIYQVSENGKKALRRFLFDNLFIPKPQRWDRKWRLVAFDIPHRHKRARDALRGKLQELNFFQLQKSVWVHPFPCESEIRYVGDVFQVAPFIEIVTVDNISKPEALNHFNPLLSEFK